MFIVEVTVPKNAPVNTSIKFKQMRIGYYVRRSISLDTNTFRNTDRKSNKINSGWFAQARGQPETQKSSS